MEPRNFLPWILSAMVHSVIIYGLYGMHGALDLDAPGGEGGNDGDGDDDHGALDLDAPGGGDGDGYDEEEVQTRSYYQTPDIHWDIISLHSSCFPNQCLRHHCDDNHDLQEQSSSFHCSPP